LPKVAIFDNMTVAESLVVALEGRDGIGRPCAVGSFHELKTLLAQDPPDVLVVDIATDNTAERLEVCDLAEVKAGQSRVLFFSRNDQLALFESVRRKGAAGFVLKSRPLQVLATAIAIVASGGEVFDSQVRPVPPHVELPSGREMQLLEALGRGLTNAGIAHELGISSRTVESHLRRMFERYNVSSRGQLLILAVHQGWLP
jgi:DNA-binding NarL/FixJ family response regulator